MMTHLRRSTSISTALGVLSLIAIGVSHLALTDIGHGEGDLTAEWRTVQIGFGLILLFHVSALVTLGRIRRHLRSWREGAGAR